MELTRPGISPLQPTQIALQVKPSLYLRLVFSVLVTFAVLNLGLYTLAKLVGQTPNPFVSYSDELLNQSLSEAVMDGCFRSVWDALNCTLPCGASYCAASPIFSHVSLTVSGDFIRQTNLSVRDHALTVGDLALLWGRPRVDMLRGHVVSLHWPGALAIAVFPGSSPRFSYFAQVVYVQLEYSSDA